MTANFGPRVLVDTDGGVDDLLALFIYLPPDRTVRGGCGSLIRQRPARPRFKRTYTLLATVQAASRWARYLGRTETHSMAPQPLRSTSTDRTVSAARAAAGLRRPPEPEAGAEKISSYSAIAAIGPFSDIAALLRAQQVGFSAALCDGRGVRRSWQHRCDSRVQRPFRR